jgi:hypothetical protein
MEKKGQRRKSEEKGKSSLSPFKAPEEEKVIKLET